MRSLDGSVVFYTDSNVAINPHTYDEYGKPSAGNTGRFQYTGQVYLKELGMNYYKARIYSPRLGRFMQTDPIGYEDNVNLYAYVGNDPINGVDPSGMALVILSDDKEFVARANAAIAEIEKTEEGAAFVQGLRDSENIHVIQESQDGESSAVAADVSRNKNGGLNADLNKGADNAKNGVETGSIISLGSSDESLTLPTTDASNLAHEFGHATDIDLGQYVPLPRASNPATGSTPKGEIRAVEYENVIRNNNPNLRRRKRYYYNGFKRDIERVRGR